MGPHHSFRVKLIIAIALLLASGFLSTYLYCILWEKPGIIMPGIIYTSATLIIFRMWKKELTIIKLFVYYGLMTLTYLFIWMLTFYSLWYGVLVGIFTAGIGALLSFEIVNRYITQLKFRRRNIFLTGSLAFLVSDLVHFAFMGLIDKSPGEYYLQTDESSIVLFADVFIYWQLLVGLRLYSVLSKSRGNT